MLIATVSTSTGCGSLCGCIHDPTFAYGCHRFFDKSAQCCSDGQPECSVAGAPPLCSSDAGQFVCPKSDGCIRRAVNPPTPSHWCTNASAPAQPGMYGDAALDLVGLKASTGQYIDVPSTVSGLWKQGLAHLFGFNGLEARRSFTTAAALAPDCTLCHWGVAASVGPNINYIVEDQATLNGAAARAATLVAAQPNLTNKTRRLVAAINKLVTSLPDAANASARAAYAASLCAPGPPDSDVDALCAGALMATTPWAYYSTRASRTRGRLLPALLPAKARLQAATSIIRIAWFIRMA